MAGSENTSKTAIFVPMKNLRFADSYLRHCHAVDRVEHLITVVGSWLKNFNELVFFLNLPFLNHQGPADDFKIAHLFLPCYPLVLQFFPSEHQLGTCFIIKFCCNIQTLGLCKRVTGNFASSAVGLLNHSGCEGKFSLTYSHPCWFHLSDGFHHIFV